MQRGLHVPVISDSFNYFYRKIQGMYLLGFLQKWADSVPDSGASIQFPVMDKEIFS